MDTIVSKQVGGALRKAGFRFSRIFQHWEGMARYDEAETLARERGGSARRVAVNTPETGRVSERDKTGTAA